MAHPALSRGRGQLSARHIQSTSPLNALTAGAVVLSLDGAIPVEFLAPGDRIVTRNSGTAVLRKVRRSMISCATATISPGTLGQLRPDRTVTLPASQEILLRDWRASALFGASRALVPVWRLLDGTFVRDTGVQSLDLVELVFDHPQIIYADGLELAAATISRNV